MMKRSQTISSLIAVAGAWMILGTAALWAQTTRTFEGIDSINFQRSADDVLYNLKSLQRSGGDRGSLSEADQFRLDYYGGNWTSIAATLKQMPAELASGVYDKMLGDLVSRGEPFMLLDDVLGVIRANPSGWTASRLKKVGLLCKACVPVMQRRWLDEQFNAGIAGLGGNDPAGRLNAGRVLIAAQFNEMAVRFLPKAEDVGRITDEAARDEVKAFYQIQQEAEAVAQPQQPPGLAEQIKVLTNSASSPADIRQAMDQVMRSAARLPPPAMNGLLAGIIKANPTAAYELVADVLKGYRSATRNASKEIRTANLFAVQLMAGTIATTISASPGDDSSWKQMLYLMADHWLSEADPVFAQRPAISKSGNTKALEAQEVIAAGPSGTWLKALSKPMAEKLDAALVRCVLVAGDFDRAATLIVDSTKRNADAGLGLADDFLVAWGERHDPNIPEPLRKRFGLPEDAHIAVTPVMMDNNIDNLAKVMSLFRQAGVPWKDNARIVAAFDAAYGNAEAYKLSHIEKVFGSAAGMSEGLVLQMVDRMRQSLSDRWRKIDIQNTNLTRRDEYQTLQMVRDGYSAAFQIADAWLAKHPDGYAVLSLAGTMMNDWADFEYFQRLAASDGTTDRALSFKEKQIKSYDYFIKSAAAYSRAVPALSPGNYTVEPYIAWFNSILGINSNGEVNLSKPMNRAGIERIRDSIRALPAKAVEPHVGLFARWVNGRMHSATTPLHEDIKYKFLASSLIITENNPFTIQAKEKEEYYDQLLSEIRLRTTIDGPTTVGRDQDFGIILSVVHTESMGRMARFGQYLTNAMSPGRAARRTPPSKAGLMPKVLRMAELQGPRDELELSLRESLDTFFDIRSITFSRPEVAPRPTDQPGWQETVLAYIHVRAKDASVDRVPPVEMNLSFLDTDGPVTIPARSAETLIKVASVSPGPRPFQQVQITQTLDPRQFAASGGLTLHIAAKAVGLVPELEDLLDLAPVKNATEIRSAAPVGPTLVKEVNSWGERVTAASEREWAVVLDASKTQDAGQAVDFVYPTARTSDETITNQTYDDANLVPVTTGKVIVGQTPGMALMTPRRSMWIWISITASALAMLLVLALLVSRRMRRRDVAAVDPRELFKLPTNVDGFVIVRLLRKLAISPQSGLADTDRAAMQQDIRHVQQAVFAPNAPGLSDGELRGIADKWLAKL